MRELKEIREQPILQILGVRGLAALGAVWIACGWVPSGSLSAALVRLVVPLGMMTAFMAVAAVAIKGHPVAVQAAGWVVASGGMGIVGIVAHEVIPSGHLRNLVGATAAMLVFAAGLLVIRYAVTVGKTAPVEKPAGR